MFVTSFRGYFWTPETPTPCFCGLGFLHPQAHNRCPEKATISKGNLICQPLMFKGYLRDIGGVYPEYPEYCRSAVASIPGWLATILQSRSDSSYSEKKSTHLTKITCLFDYLFRFTKLSAQFLPPLHTYFVSKTNSIPQTVEKDVIPSPTIRSITVFSPPKQIHAFRSAAEAALNKRATMVEIVATCAP